MNRIDVITIFPEWFDSLREIGVTGRALAAGRVELKTWNPREFTSDRHRTVDDRPYGGGPGMVMRPEPLAAAIEAVQGDGGNDSGTPVSALSPQGKRLDQAAVEALSRRQRLILVCGRYEGIDERVLDELVDEEWSLGDYVLSGGELGAAVVIDAVVRLLPEVLGHERSAAEDSFVDGLLDCPHYTRPEEWRGREVPEVLKSGDHAAVDRWRRKQALGRTWERRPDLLQRLALDESDQKLLDDYKRKKIS